MRIALAADAAGSPVVALIEERLTRLGVKVLTPFADPPTPEYPVMSFEVAAMVADGRADLGVLVGGSGQGEVIAANKVAGVRAVLGSEEFTTRIARAHQNANVLALGARSTEPHRLLQLVELFVTTPFEGGRHLPRLQMISDYERDRHGPLTEGDE